MKATTRQVILACVLFFLHGLGDESTSQGWLTSLHYFFSALYNPKGAPAIIGFVCFIGVALGLWIREWRIEWKAHDTADELTGHAQATFGPDLEQNGFYQ